MSFTGIVKNEVSKIDSNEFEKIAELNAILTNGAVIDNDIIKITTENASVARRIYNLIKDIYKFIPNIIVRKSLKFNKKLIYIVYFKKNNIEIMNIPKKYIIDDEESIRAYLRGVFIITGSINDPKTSRYHLEFLVSDYDYAQFLNELLNNYKLNSKVLTRENKYMVYIKEAEKISDFLRVISAYNAVLYYEDIRIYRDHKNMTNRLNNCEQANIDKVIETANKQLNDIEIIKKVNIELLDEKEKIVAFYRIKYPDVSLLELSEIISMETGNKITKSGLYHRFKKISQLACKLKEKL